MTGLRVVQWATGNIGSRSLRHVIEHPGLTLAGVYVTSAAKAGRDAGELCGLPPTGVTATNDTAEILALRADCVLYMPAVCDLDHDVAVAFPAAGEFDAVAFFGAAWASCLVPVWPHRSAPARCHA